MSSPMMTSPIKPEQIQEFATTWFRALDVHAPIEQCWSMLSDDDLHMHFPDGDIRDFATFKKWYDRVINLFFDEKHAVRKLEVHSATEDQADVTVVVGWQARWWKAPASESQRVDLEATQRWTIRACPTTRNAFGLEICAYIMDDNIEFAQGSAGLPPPTTEPNQDLIALNERIGEMEQKRDEEAHKFFEKRLSEKLIFRRANGAVVSKSEPEGFLESLNRTDPFKSRRSEDLYVTSLGDRALVTLIVVATRADNSVARYRNIRLFSRFGDDWLLDFWYNYEITSL